MVRNIQCVIYLPQDRELFDLYQMKQFTDVKLQSIKGLVKVSIVNEKFWIGWFNQAWMKCDFATVNMILFV